MHAKAHYILFLKRSPEEPPIRKPSKLPRFWPKLTNAKDPRSTDSAAEKKPDRQNTEIAVYVYIYIYIARSALQDNKVKNYAYSPAEFTRLNRL